MVLDYDARLPGQVKQFDELFRTYEVPKLVEQVRLNFQLSFNQDHPIRLLWLLNLELTRRGVAPAWRGIPEFFNVRGAKDSAGDATGTSLPGAIRKLTATQKNSLLRRWIDLEWLWVELGPSHLTRQKTWRGAFDADFTKAAAAFEKINAVRSHGGGKIGPLPAFQTLFRLDLPERVRTPLAGLIARDEGERLKNVRMRVQTRIRPLVEALMERATHPLTQDEVDLRLLYCEAIELARGHPAEAAQIYHWMTGNRVSRQNMQIMKGRIADQCKLTTKAWRPVISQR